MCSRLHLGTYISYPTEELALQGCEISDTRRFHARKRVAGVGCHLSILCSCQTLTFRIQPTYRLRIGFGYGRPERASRCVFHNTSSATSQKSCSQLSASQDRPVNRSGYLKLDRVEYSKSRRPTKTLCLLTPAEILSRTNSRSWTHRKSRVIVSRSRSSLTALFWVPQHTSI